MNKEKWLEQVSTMMKFPARVLINLSMSADNKPSIVFTTLTGAQQRKELKNLKYTEVSYWDLSGGAYTPLKVKDYMDAGDLYDDVVALNRIWIEPYKKGVVTSEQ
jgi:peptidoglycan hydrolase-like amidase